MEAVEIGRPGGERGRTADSGRRYRLPEATQPPHIPIYQRRHSADGVTLPTALYAALRTGAAGRYSGARHPGPHQMENALGTAAAAGVGTGAARCVGPWKAASDGLSVIAVEKNSECGGTGQETNIFSVSGTKVQIENGFAEFDLTTAIQSQAKLQNLGTTMDRTLLAGFLPREHEAMDWMGNNGVQWGIEQECYGVEGLCWEGNEAGGFEARAYMDEHMCRRPITPELAEAGADLDRMPEALGPHDYMDGVRTALEAGVIKQADTIAELAEQLGFDPDVLEAAVEGWNAVCEAGVDQAFGYKANWLKPVVKPPFYGAAVGGTILSTAAGLKFNAKMQVIGKTGKVIPGLYTAGCNGGGLCGVSTGFLGGEGVSVSATGGYVAACTIAAEE